MSEAAGKGRDHDRLHSNCGHDDAKLQGIETQFPSAEGAGEDSKDSDCVFLPDQHVDIPLRPTPTPHRAPPTPVLSDRSASAPAFLSPHPAPSKPLLSLVKSLSTEIDPKEVSVSSLSPSFSPSPRPKPLLSLVKSLSSDISRREPEAAQSKSDSKPSLPMWKQLTQPRAEPEGEDLETVPPTPANPSPTEPEPRGSGFFKAELEDTRRKFSEAMQEPLSMLSKIIREDSPKLQQQHQSRAPEVTDSVGGVVRGGPSSGSERGAQESYAEGVEKPGGRAWQTKCTAHCPSPSHAPAITQNSRYKICTYGDVIQVVEIAGPSAEPDGGGAILQAQGPRGPSLPSISGSGRWLFYVSALAYGFFVLPLPSYWAGLALGLAGGFMLGLLVVLLLAPRRRSSLHPRLGSASLPDILRAETPSQEHRNPKLLRGWMNEIQGYNPETYHPSLTHSVYATLEGSCLQLAYPRTNISRRATFHDPAPDPAQDIVFSHSRQFQLAGSKVSAPPWLTPTIAGCTLQEIRVRFCPELGFPRIGEQSEFSCDVRPSYLLVCGGYRSEFGPAQTDRDLPDNIQHVGYYRVFGDDPTGRYVIERKPEVTKMVRWTGEMEEHLVAMWEENECLYNISSQDYTNRVMKDSAPGEMARAVGVAVLARKRVWNKKYPICLVLAEDAVVKEKEVGKEGAERDQDEQGERAEQDEPAVTMLQAPVTLFLFGRTGREKEEWFQHFLSASKATDHDRGCGSKSGEGSRKPDKDVSTQQNSAPAGQAECSGGSSRGSSDDIPSLLRLKDLAGSVREKILLDYSAYMARFVVSEEESAPASPSHSNGDDPTATEKSCEPIAGVNGEFQPDITRGVNALIGRIFWDFLREKYWANQVAHKIQKKLTKIRLPYFMNELTLTELDMGTCMPQVLNMSRPSVDNRGLWLEMEVMYTGSLQMTLETKMNLCKLGKEGGAEADSVPESGYMSSRPRLCILADSDEESSSAGSSDEEEVLPSEPQGAVGDKGTQPGVEGHIGSSTSRKILKFVDKIAKSKYFQKATENEYIKKKIEEVSNTPLLLTVEVQELSGPLAVNIPPPPTDRIWYSFRVPPRLDLRVRPMLGEREVTFTHVTEWIEKKLQREFQKVLVMPNMDDLYLPLMHSGLDSPPSSQHSPASCSRESSMDVAEKHVTSE